MTISFDLGVHEALTKFASDVRNQTAQLARSQIWGTKRAVAKTVDNKPKILKVPQPAKPQVEPSTFTPSQPPVAMQPEKTAAKKRSRRKGAEDNLGEPRTTWKGMRVKEHRPGPENEPEPESWRGHDF